MKVSARRYNLDKQICKMRFFGKVLDVGGKKHKARGAFMPPLKETECWKYLNVDASTEPDYHCSAEQIPVEDNYFDIVLLLEVLEHLERPEMVLREIWRVLKTNGFIIASMPFLTPLHGCPYDFQRWSPDKIRREFQKAGFTVKNLVPLGGVIAVVTDLLYKHASKSSSSFYRKITRSLINLLFPALLFLDRRMQQTSRITTGFFITAWKQQ